MDEARLGGPVAHKTPATHELLDLLTQHQVIEADALWQYLSSRGGVSALPAEGEPVLAELLRGGLLTAFQAEMVRSGAVDRLRVGRYLVLTRLGGPDSSVYLARKPPGSERVALKVLPAGEGVRPSAVERFRREAEALARLEHPGIVAIKDSGTDGDRLFLAMEYVDGASLVDLVEQQGTLRPAPATRIIHEAALAVEYIHEMGLLHRDLQPAHLLVDAEGRVRILDLGVARFLDDPGGNLTRKLDAGQVLGEVEFQAPEQLLDSHAVDRRADVYGLGATFYYLLTGRAPFSQHALLRLAAGVETFPQPVGQVRDDVPRVIATVVEKMMARRPEDRYATPAEAAHALEGWLAEVAPPPLKAPVRRSSARVPVIRIETTDGDLVMPTSEEPDATEERGVSAWMLVVAAFIVSGLVFLAVWAMGLGG